MGDYLQQLHQCNVWKKGSNFKSAGPMLVTVGPFNIISTFRQSNMACWKIMENQQFIHFWLILPLNFYELHLVRGFPIAMFDDTRGCLEILSGLPLSG